MELHEELVPRDLFASPWATAALQAKDYPTAQQNLKEVVAAQPTDVNSIYLLALAYLSPKPPVVDGLFWIAKAAATCSAAGSVCEEPVHPLSRQR